MYTQKYRVRATIKLSPSGTLNIVRADIQSGGNQDLMITSTNSKKFLVLLVE